MRTTWTLIIFGIGLLAGANSEETSIRQMIEKIPPNSGYDFRCEDIMQAVNALRRIGREKALEELRAYVKESPPVTRENVLLICRVLFVNTNAWKVVVPGVPTPNVGTNAFALFPLFPIAISDGVPFELVAGYSGGGFFGNPPDACVKYCEGLPIISTDLVQTNYEAAARSLIQSKEFKRLYQDVDDRRKVEELLLRQAGSNDSNRPVAK